MKKLTKTLLSLSMMLIASFSCKKENIPPTIENPDTSYRLTKYEQINYVDTTSTTSSYTYQDEKLKVFEHAIDPGLHAFSHYSYGVGAIHRVDTNYNNWYYDSVGYTTTEYTLTDGHIVKAIINSTNYYQTINYEYIAGNLVQWEIFDGQEELLVTRGEYDYSGDMLTSYSFYQLNSEDEVELKEKNGYTYTNGKLDEVFYYYSSIYTKPPELQRKLKYRYDGDLPSTVDWYSYTSDEEWNLFYQTRLTYNTDNLLLEAADYTITDEENILRYQDYFEYETGKGNLEFLRTSNIRSPRMQGVFPAWGMY